MGKSLRVVQLIRSATSIPVVGYNTGRGKMSLQYQAELLASEMERGKWILRGGHVDEVCGLERDLLYYSPTKHTPDRLAALCFARWGAERRSHRAQHLLLDMNRR